MVSIFQQRKATKQLVWRARVVVYLVRQNYKNNRQIFKNVGQLISKAVDTKVTIEHIGSTAIPGMLGKNIVDVLVGVDDAKKIKKSAETLVKHGFFLGKNPDYKEHVFLASSENETVSGDVHIHIVIKNSDRYRQFILLRDFLLNNPNARKLYSDAKKRIIAKFGNDRERYKKEKSKFVSQLIKQVSDTEARKSNPRATRAKRTK